MATSNSTGPLVYVGPTITALGLHQFSVFADGAIPQHIEPLRRKSSAMRMLIVPVSRLVEARQELSTKGSLLSTMFARLLGELT